MLREVQWGPSLHRRDQLFNVTFPGTFSHRHAVVHDQKTQRKSRDTIANAASVTRDLAGTHCPLKHVNPNTQFVISNSHLSEMGVLGFE